MERHGLRHLMLAAFALAGSALGSTAARADYVYTFNTTQAAPGAGSVDGTLTIRDSAVESGVVTASGFDLFTFFLDDSENGDQFQQTDHRFVSGARVSHRRLGRLGRFETQNTIGVQLRNDRISPVALYHTVARERLAPYNRIRRIEYTDLPKTISGKIRRVELRRQEEGRSGASTTEFREEDCS